MRDSLRSDDADGPDEPGRASAWLCAAIAQAVADAGLDGDLRDVPVLVGTGLRELRSAELAWQSGVSGLLPDLGPALRERFGAVDVQVFSNACSASLHTLGLADDLLRLGQADTVVVAGVDTMTLSMFGLLDVVQPDGVAELRPFQSGRKGVLMGDGAVAVVLRRAASADDAYAWLRGVGITCDAYHPTAPDPQGIAAAMRDAHRRAGVRSEDIDVVIAHGTGTALNDTAEAAALASVFAAGGGPLVTGIKGMTGHTSGSSGLLSLTVAVRALRAGWVPPIHGLAEPVAEAGGLRFAYELTEAREARYAQVNAFGFGGVNAVAIVEGNR
jgi:3-oxoacyl-[acyl-carrier-protein] synthase II